MLRAMPELPAVCTHSLHGDPLKCSQCRGFTPKRLTRDLVTGKLLQDGQPVDREWQTVTYGRQPPRLVAKAKKRALDAAALLLPAEEIEDEDL